MEKEIIVVSDTNVFIDLYSIGLLKEFFSLPWEVHTTDLVMFELKRQWQNEEVSQYATKGLLYIPSLSAVEMQVIVNMMMNSRRDTNVSLADCSVWYYARENNCILLTGDRKLKGVSSRDGIEVHGTIYIFDKMVEHKALHPALAADKLEQLYSINHRLPKSEIDLRIEKWRGSLKKWRA